MNSLMKADIIWKICQDNTLTPEGQRKEIARILRELERKAKMEGQA